MLYNDYDDTEIGETDEISIFDILEKTGFRIVHPFYRDDLKKLLDNWLSDDDTYIAIYDVEKIIMKLLALGLITVDGSEEFSTIEVTNLGKEIILSTVEF